MTENLRPAGNDAYYGQNELSMAAEGGPPEIEDFAEALEARIQPPIDATAVVTRQEDVLSPNSLGMIREMAMDFFKSGLYPGMDNPAHAVAKILAGMELGIGASTALAGLYVIEGKITMSAGLVASQIKKHGDYDFRVTEHTDQVCTIEFFQRGDSLGASSFSMQDAALANLNRGAWRTYPRNMLFARALTNGARWYTPDVFGGSIYTPDELGADVQYDSQGTENYGVPAPRTMQAPAPRTMQAPAPEAEQCPLHPSNKFFKTENMRSYAHPVDGQEGPRGGKVWCNWDDVVAKARTLAMKRVTDIAGAADMVGWIKVHVGLNEGVETIEHWKKVSDAALAAASAESEKGTGNE